MSNLTHQELIERSKEHTLRANLAQERLAGWIQLGRALLRLMLAYEGNELHPKIKSWYDAIAPEKASRQEKLQQVLESERQNAQRMLQEFNEKEWF